MFSHHSRFLITLQDQQKSNWSGPVNKRKKSFQNYFFSKMFEKISKLFASQKNNFLIYMKQGDSNPPAP